MIRAAFYLSFFLLFLTSTKGQNALSFDGIDDYIQTTYGGISGGTAPRTIEAWIRTTANSLPSADGQQVIADYGSFTTGGRFTFNVLWGNAIRLEVGGNGLSGNIAINDSLWHHVAVVYDPSLTNSISLYVDGVLDVAGNVTVPVITGSSTDLRIGQRIDGVNGFTGDIDEVRVWSVALDTAQLRASRNNEFCTIPNGLVAYYPLNEGIAGGMNASITTTLDKVNGNNGTLNGFALTGNSSNWINGAGITSGATFGTITATDCQSYVSPSGNYTYTASGTYTDTITNAASCDSIITINLTLINNPTFASISVTSCDSYTSPSGKFTFTSSGSYLDTIPNSQNCDSVIAISLTINSVNNGIGLTSGGSSATAVEVGARYQWLDCNNGFAVLANDTNRSFTPSSNGAYAVEVTKNGCTDTSNCVTFTSVGNIENNLESQLTISPNPTKGMLVIDFGNIIGWKQYTVRNMVGQLITAGKILDKNLLLNLNQQKGIYLIEIELIDGSKTIRKVIKH